MVSIYFCVYFFTILSIVLCNNNTTKVITTNDSIIIMEDQKSFNTLLKGNVIPIIQNRMNYDAVKKSMDNFSMVRRKTHFLIPGLNVNSFTVYNDDLNRASKGTSYRAVNIESYKHNGYNKINNIRQELDVKNKEDIFNKVNEINHNFLDENKDNFDNINGIKHHFVNMNNRPSIYENPNDISVKNNINNNLDDIDNLHNNLINIQNRGYNFETINDPNNVNDKRNVYNQFTNMHQQFVNKNKADNFNNKHDVNNASEGNNTKINELNGTLNEVDDNKPITDYYNEIAKIYEQFKHNDFDEYFTYEQELELLKILRKQEKIIKNITSTKKPKKKKSKKRKESTEFEDLIKNVKEQKNIVKSKHNYTDFTFETTPTTISTTRRTTTVRTTTEKPTTILTVLNEIDVRTALKNDPYVKRILKMANMKRQKYVKNALLTIYN